MYDPCEEYGGCIGKKLPKYYVTTSGSCRVGVKGNRSATII